MHFGTFDRSWIERLRSSRRQLLQGAAAAGVASLAARRAALADQPKVLRVRSDSDIQGIDPNNPAAAADQNVMMAIFNKLISYKPGTTWGWKLEAAEKIEVVDPKTIKFRLMPNIMWTKGFGEMTTEDVKYSFERLGKLKSWAAVDWSTLKDVEIVDKYNGIIHLKSPFEPLFHSTLPYGSGTIVCKKAVEALPSKTFTTTPPAESGPYKIKEWVQKQKLVLERHDGWPGPKPYFDVIDIRPIEDAKTAQIAYEAGELDITGISVSSVPDYKKQLPKKTEMTVLPPLEYFWIGMNVDHQPFDDLRVRRAIQLGVDVQQILDAAYFGVPQRATGIIAPGLVGHRPENIYRDRDLERAKTLLKEAGLEKGFKTTIAVQNVTDHVAVAQVVQANLADLGITVDINAMDSGTFWTLGIEKDGDSWKNLQMIYNNYNMAPDPFWATSWFVPSQIGEWNWERWNSPEFGRMNKQAVAEADPLRRNELYVQMQDMMEEGGAYVFVTHGVSAFIYRDGLKPAMTPDGGSFLFRDFAAA